MLATPPLAALVGSARVVVVPSLWQEPGGTATFEAMAQSRAVVVSKVGGAAEPVEDGIEGVLVDPGDELALAQAMRRLATDLPFARRLGQSGRRKVLEQFSISRHMARLQRYYEEVIAAPDVAGLR